MVEIAPKGIDKVSSMCYIVAMIRKEQMEGMRSKGFSYGQIDKVFGISRQRVQQIIGGYDKLNINLSYSPNGYYATIKQLVLERDKYECQKCSAMDKLIAHHIDGDNHNNKLSNLITLCNRCHLALHRPPTIDIDVKKIRESMPMTQRQFAKHLGVSESAVSRWEHGIRHVSQEVFDKIAHLLQ